MSLDPSEADVDRLHSALIESPTHHANILNPCVAYVGVGLSMGSVAGQGGTQDALFLTQNFANSTQPVSVQKVVDGQTVTSSYVDGEPVLGTSELVPDANETPTDNDDASVEVVGRGADDGQEL